MKKEIKVYVVEGQNISKLIRLYVEGVVASDAPIPPSSGSGRAEVSHQKDNVTILSGDVESLYRTPDIEKAVNSFKPDVVIIPVDLNSPFNREKINLWHESLKYLARPPQQILLGVITDSSAALDKGTLEAITSIQQGNEGHEFSSVTICSLDKTNTVQAVFNKAQELALKAGTQANKQPSTDQQQNPDTPAQNGALAEQKKVLKGRTGGIFKKNAATDESASTLRASSADITTQQPEAKPPVAHEERKPSFINRTSSLLSKRAASVEGNIIDTMAITLKSSEEKINAQQIIRTAVFSGEAERRSEVKPMNPHETVIRVLANPENSKIQFSAEYPRKDEAVVASQMAKVVAKAADAIPNGASAKIVQDNHSESMKDALNATEKKNDLEVTTPSITFINKGRSGN